MVEMFEYSGASPKAANDNSAITKALTSENAPDKCRELVRILRYEFQAGAEISVIRNALVPIMGHMLLALHPQCRYVSDNKFNSAVGGAVDLILSEVTRSSAEIVNRPTISF